MVICQLFWHLKSLPFLLIYHVIFGFWERLVIFFFFLPQLHVFGFTEALSPSHFFSSFSFLVLSRFPLHFCSFLDRPSPAVVTSTSRLFPAPYFFFFCSSQQQQQQDRSSRGSRPEQLDSPELRLSGDFRWCRLLVELHSSSKSSILNFQT